MPQGLDFSGTFLGAAVQWVGGAAGRRLKESVTGPPAEAALRHVVTAAVPAAVTEVTEEAHRRDVTDAVALHLGQRPDTDPADLDDPERLLRAWLAPLDDPEAAGPGASTGYLRERGVDPGDLVRALHRHILDGVRRNAVRGGPLAALWQELRAQGAGDGTARALRESDARSKARHEETWSRIDAVQTIIDRAAATGPGPASPEVPRQLPAAPPDFTGRARELAELKELCAPPARGPVVISGPSGVGKSALATYLAHELDDAYPDGRLYGVLSADDGPEALRTRFLRALGVSPSGGPEEQAAAYRTALAGRRLLILLDNIAGEAQVRPLLPGDGGSLVLVTSRGALPALEGATTYPLGVLDPGDAVAVLSNAAGPGRVQEDDDAYAIAELCGWLPLAVRIAGARLKARPDWAPGHLRERLGDVRGRLRELRTGDLDVRSGFELSYRDLDEDAAGLFRALFAYPGPTFSAGLAAALAGRPEREADDLLGVLLLNHLVEPAEHGGHYRMHDLLKLFSAEKADAAGIDHTEAGLRVFRWYLDRLGRYTPALLREEEPAPSGARQTPLPEAVAWVEAEAVNLTHLMGFSKYLGFDEATAGMAYVVAAVAGHLGMTEAALQVLDDGIAAARRRDDDVQLAILLRWRGQHMAVRDHSWEGAIASWEEALGLLGPSDPPELRAGLHNSLAHAHLARNRTADADREFAAFEEVARAHDIFGTELGVGFYHAWRLIGQQRHAAAAKLLEPLLPMAREAGVGTEVDLHLQLAEAYRGAGMGKRERLLLSECAGLCRKHGLRNRLPEVLWHLGVAEERRDRRDKARAAWHEGLQVAEETGNSGMAARMCYHLGEDQEKAGDAVAAEELFVRAAEEFGEAGQPNNRAGALDRAALLRRAHGDGEGARELWIEALASLNEVADRRHAEDRKQQVKLKIADLRRRT